MLVIVQYSLEFDTSLDHSSPNLIQAPDDLNVNNSLQLVNNVVSPINEDLNIQFTPGICIGYSTRFRRV
jgi:hypothetical protein